MAKMNWKCKNYGEGSKTRWVCHAVGFVYSRQDLPSTCQGCKHYEPFGFVKKDGE